MSTEMYQEIILDYYKNPREFGCIMDADICQCERNPACGDQIKFMAKVKDGKILEIKFSGEGCAISIATASMIAEFLKGKTIDEIVKLTKEDVLKMIPVKVSPMRLKCALLGFKAIKLGVYKYISENGN